MSMFGIDGLSSGLDTTSIINQLMQLERQPAVRLQTRQASNRSAISALQTIGTTLATVNAAAKALNDATTSFQPRIARSTGTNVTATASATAELGSVAFTVDRLAARHAVSVNGLAPSRDQVVNSSGADKTITVGGTNLVIADGTTLRQMADQINAVEGTTIKASLVDTGAGIKLQLDQATAGAAGVFTVAIGELDAAAFGTNPDSLDTQVLSQGQDAQITVGTGAGKYAVTSTTNTFNDVIAGLSFTATSPSTELVTVSVEGDPDKLTNRVKAFVDAVNAAVGEMDRQLKSGIDGGTPGALPGNSAIRTLRDQLIGAVTFPVAGSALTSGGLVGIQSTRQGTLTFDAAAFRTAHEADPAAVERLFRSGDADNPGIAGRVLARAEDATRANTGTIATVVRSRETENRGFTEQIEAIDRRIELRRATLQRQFSNLEVVLGRMQSQQSWLSSQIGALNANRPRN
jgi:flagellar hook-associated protein 2